MMQLASILDPAVTVLADQPRAEVPVRVTPGAVGVVRAVLRAVVLDEKALALDAVIVRPAGFSLPAQANAVPSKAPSAKTCSY